jgi:hypothetical protein
MQVYTRLGTALGSTATTGPASNAAGWNLHAVVTVKQSATGELSLPITIPNLPILAGQTIGMALIFVDAAPRYVGSGLTTPTTYSNSICDRPGEVKSTPSSAVSFVSRQLLGNVYTLTCCSEWFE